MEIGNVALVATAQFDTERGNQNQTAEAGSRTNHHFSGDPAAEIGPDQHGVFKAQFFGKIEIKVRQVVDATRTAVDQRRSAIAGMPGRYNPIVARQQLKPWPLRRQPLAGVEKQQRSALTAFDQFKAGAGEADGAGHLTASSMRTWLIMVLLFAAVGPGDRRRPREWRVRRMRR